MKITQIIKNIFECKRYDCTYHSPESVLSGCDYCLIMGHPRHCKLGDNCDKYRKANTMTSTFREVTSMLMPCINSFSNEYSFLSNFYETDIEYDGILYSSSEAAYQAQKCRTLGERLHFSSLSPVAAKRLGRRVSIREDWNDIRLTIMEEIVRIKFTTNDELAQKLLSTENIPLVEGNTWGDRFWGVDTTSGKGENHLGRILMKIRRELQRTVTC